MATRKKLTRKGTMLVTIDEAQELLANPHLWADPAVALIKKKQEEEEAAAAAAPAPEAAPAAGGDTDEEDQGDEEEDFEQKKKRPGKKAAAKKKEPAKKKAKKPAAAAAKKPQRIEITPISDASLAYEFAGQLVLDRLTPAEKQKLAGFKAEDLLFIQGSADSSEKVAGVVNVPYKLVAPSEFDSVDLSRPFEQSVYVNCMASFSAKGAKRLAEFVAAGGLVVTTDHAIEQLALTFPGVIDKAGATQDSSVDVRVTSFGHSVLQGFADEDVHPQWKMAGGSYAIKVLDKSRVDVLLTSDKLKEMVPEGEGAVVVTFTAGLGRVYHISSHFYLQGSASYSDMKASEYAKRKMASEELVAKFEAAEQNKKLDKGAVQAAATMVEFLLRSILEHPQAPAAATTTTSSTTAEPAEK